MRVVPVEQRTPEWYEWRARGVGSSDSTVIMGEVIDPDNPVTVADLIEEKLGRARRVATYAMRRGTSLERPCLRLLEQEHGILVRPACVQHDTVDWLRASLDGLTFLADLTVEAKAVKVVDHEVALAGVVPRVYRWQVQHQLIVTELETALYVSYSTAKRFGASKENPSLAVVWVEADAEAQAELLAAEEAFFARLCRCRESGRLVA